VRGVSLLGNSISNVSLALVYPPLHLPLTDPGCLAELPRRGIPTPALFPAQRHRLGDGLPRVAELRVPRRDGRPRPDAVLRRQLKVKVRLQLDVGVGRGHGEEALDGDGRVARALHDILKHGDEGVVDAHDGIHVGVVAQRGGPPQAAKGNACRVEFVELGLHVLHGP